MKKLILLFATAFACAFTHGATRAVTPTAWDGDPNCEQMKRHLEKMAVVTNGGAKVVFIGDSITHYWETNGKVQLEKYLSEGDLKMLNLGISGDRTEHVLWRLTEGKELDGFEAKVIFLMIGTNNTGHFKFAEEPPIDTILGIHEIVKVIRQKQPKALLVLTSIFPRGMAPTDERRLRNDIVNREIRKFEDGKDIVWLDMDKVLAMPDGMTVLRAYHADYVHPNAVGYELWYKALRPYLAAGLADSRMPLGKSDPASTGVFNPKNEPLALCPAARISEGWWRDRLLEKRNQIADSKGEIDLVFLGDSITHFWETNGKAALEELRKTYSVLDLGYSGDRTEHLLWRGQNGELDGYKAKCIMLMIGTNNSWHRSDKPADIAEGIKRILKLIAVKQPQAKTLLLPIFPFGNAGPKNGLRANNDKVNEIIKGFATGKSVIWVDFGAKFCDADGKVTAWMPDGVHPHGGGYSKVWMPSVLPYFKEIVGK